MGGPLSGGAAVLMRNLSFLGAFYFMRWMSSSILRCRSWLVSGLSGRLSDWSTPAERKTSDIMGEGTISLNCSSTFRAVSSID